MADIPPRAATPADGKNPSSAVQRDRTRGVASMIIGATVALLAPLTGFLGGTIVGSSSTVADLDPLFLWLFVGMVVGGIGGAVAIMGALRWVRANRRSQMTTVDESDA